jgi:hypothetical protein
MPVGGRCSETWSHPIDMIIVTIIYTDDKKQSSPATRHGGALGTGRIAPTHSLPRYWMGLSYQRHVPAALCSRKGPPVPIVQEARWAPEPVWTQRLEEKSLSSAEDRTPDRSVV